MCLFGPVCCVNTKAIFGHPKRKCHQGATHWDAKHIKKCRRTCKHGSQVLEKPPITIDANMYQHMGHLLGNMGKPSF